MKLLKPDYNNSLINISQSLLKYYNNQAFYPSIKIIDKALNKDPKHVFLILLDGLGYHILNKHLGDDSLLIKHLKAKLTSVFPPTTVAATNALLSGLPPISNGYLGWIQYDIETSTNTVVFRNEDFYNPKHKLTESFILKHLKYQDIFDQIKEKNPDLMIYKLFPDFLVNGYKSFSAQVDKLIEISNQNQKSLSYCYWTEPDSTMHDFGPNSKEASQVILNLELDYQRLISNLGPDTLVMVIADHGMVEVNPNLALLDNQFLKLFKILPSIEPRAMTVFIRDEAHQEFLDYYHKNLKDKFILMTKSEIFYENLLGFGKKHPKLDSFIGDYILIAKSDEYFMMSLLDKFKGHHAGLTEEEIEIPLILFYKPKKINDPY